MFDRYQYWNPPGTQRAIRRPGESIEDEVLKDLAGTDNVLEKYQVLDSYAAYAKRCYRSTLLEGISNQAGVTFTSLIGPWLKSFFPDITPPHRPVSIGR